MSDVLLQARDVSKRFLGVQALDRVSVDFRTGEVVAVMGENGAGKSTLMKCLAGVHEPDAGTLTWMAQSVRIGSARRAEQLGIAFIHQELNLCSNLDIAGNVFLGREIRRWGGFLDGPVMRRRTAALLARVGLRADPETPVASLSIGQQQLVEIARALSQDARMVIMDEPTSSLTAGEAATLFGVVRDLRSQGICVVFISHRIPEVMSVADRVVVLRDGRNSGAMERGAMSPEAIVGLMVGRELASSATRPGRERGPALLEVTDLRTPAWPDRPVSFVLHAGEITGVAGLVGAGRTELARAVFGIDRPVAGRIAVAGKVLPPGNPRAAIAAGIALVPEDRKEQGLILDMAIRDNLSLPGLVRFQRGGLVRDASVDAMATEMTERLSVRTTGIAKAVGELSGGNQQKVALGRWLVLDPRVIILDEPTRGVDVGSKREIYAIMESLAARGAAVLAISSDLEEVLRISDRVMVLHEGAVAGILDRAAATEEAVMRLATGGTFPQESAA